MNLTSPPCDLIISLAILIPRPLSPFNLLREGLDLPEVSLVAVLDADKEGFLRSRTALMQVSGRTARNVNGMVLLYGDKITDSMQYLIDETNRRRKIQKKYNKINKINPKTIYKSLDEIRITTTVADERVDNHDNGKIKLDDSTLDGIEASETLASLKRKMLKHARNLQFEQAAILRDKIRSIEDVL